MKYLLIYIFSSFLILFKNYSRNLNEDILLLVFAFVAFAFVDSVANSGSVAGWCVGILSKFLYCK